MGNSEPTTEQLFRLISATRGACSIMPRGAYRDDLIDALKPFDDFPGVTTHEIATPDRHARRRDDVIRDLIDEAEHDQLVVNPATGEPLYRECAFVAKYLLGKLSRVPKIEHRFEQGIKHEQVREHFHETRSTRAGTSGSARESRE